MRSKYPYTGTFSHFLLRGGVAFVLLLAVVPGWAQRSTKINWLDSVSKVSPDKALPLTRQALRSSETSPLEKGRLQLLQGKYFNELAMYDSAVKVLTLVQPSLISLKDSTALADSYYEIGVAQGLTAKYKESIATQQKAFVLYQKIKNNDGAVKALLRLADASAKTKKYPQAKEYYDQALERAQRNGAYKLIAEAHDGLANIFETQKDYRRAITNVRLMQHALDSIAVREKRRELSELEEKYGKQLEQKERALIASEAQHKSAQTERLLRLIERDDIQLTFYSVALALVFIVLVLVVAWLITRRKAVVAEKELRHEKKATKTTNEHYDIISQQVNEELVRSLNDISFAANEIVASKNNDDAAALKLHTETLVGTMRDMIWLINPNNKSLEGWVAYLREQLNSWLKQSGVTYMIIVPDRLPNIDLTSLERVNLFVVTRDMVSHCIRSARASGVTVSISLEGRQLVFRVRDNTPGADEEKTTKRADELKPWREKMEQIGGTIGVIVENSSMVVIYRFNQK